MTWVAGKTHLIADALSRAPLDHGSDIDEDIDCADTNVVNFVRKTVCHFGNNFGVVKSLEDAASSDEEYVELIDAFVNNKCPRRLPVGHPARAYLSIWDRLTLAGRLLAIDGCRVVIPPSKRKEVLQRLHASHSGIVKTKQLARQLFYWPGMTNQIEQAIGACEKCNALRPSQQAEPLNLREASNPMEEVATDLFSFAGKDYLVAVDRFSGWIFCDRLPRTSTGDVTGLLEQWFGMFGLPLRIASDNGPQFRSDFDAFCAKHSIEHVTSSPHFPSSNGLAESAVKQAKNLLEKCNGDLKEFQKALSEYRNVPRADGVSASQLFLGRRQKTPSSVYALPNAFSFDSAQVERGQKTRQETRHKTKTRFDQRSKVYPTLRAGQHVLVQHHGTKRWTIPATVVDIRPNGRSYLLDMDGKVKVRNRRFVRPVLTNDIGKPNRSDDDRHEENVVVKRRGRPRGSTVSRGPATRRSPRLNNQASSTLQKNVSFREDFNRVHVYVSND